MKKELLVDAIRIDGDTQAREKLHEDTVAEYAELKNLPEVVVFHDGTDFWLADGFHRVIAAQRKKVKHIPAEVHKGSKLDAAWFACGANQAHGLRRTNGDKRKAVKMALELEGGKSARDIADHCGVSHEFVRGVKGGQVSTVDTSKSNSLANSSTFTPPAVLRHGPPPALKVTGKDGKKYPEKQQPKVILDGPGRIVPERCLPYWNRTDEIQDALTAISRLRTLVQEAQESKDPLFFAMPFPAVIAALSNAYNGFSVCKPYAVCPTCQGLRGCKLCGESGLISKFRWDTTVSEELKKEIAYQAEKIKHDNMS